MSNSNTPLLQGVQKWGNDATALSTNLLPEALHTHPYKNVPVMGIQHGLRFVTTFNS